MIKQTVPFAALVLLLAVVSCSSDLERQGGMLAADAKRLFNDAFATPYEHIDLKASEGSAWHGHDAWILFTSNKAVSLQRAELYHEVNPSPYMERFSAALGKSPDLLDAELAPCCLLYRDSSVVYPNGKCLLFDEKHGVYYFRSWKHY
jgi:hypothetical protein